MSTTHPAQISEVTGGVSRSLADKLSEIVSVKDYGAKGDGTTDDTSALDNALTAAIAAGGVLLVPPGVYNRTTPWQIKPGVRVRGAGRYGKSSIGPDTSSAVHFQGDPSAAVIRNTAGGHVIEITNLGSVPASIQRDTEISDLVLEGPATDALGHTVGSGHGIYVHDVDTGGGPSGLNLHDLWIVSVGGKGLYVTQEFTSYFSRIDIHNCGDHAFDVQGGNTTRLDSCYAHWVGAYSSGSPYYPAGFRIHGGNNTTLIGCNGIDSGRDWGVFGDTVAEDGIARTAYVTMIGCNVEAASRYGVRCKTSSRVDLRGCSFVAYVANTIGVSLDTPPSGMLIDDSNVFNLNGGPATWANGWAIHSKSSFPVTAGRLGLQFNGTNNVAWDDGGAAATGLSGYDFTNSAFRIYPLIVAPGNASNVSARIFGQYGGAAAWAPGTVAASSGGIPGSATTTVTVSFGAIGRPCFAGFTNGGAALPAGVEIMAKETGANTVTVTIYNFTASPVTLASGTVTVSSWQLQGGP